MSSFPVSSKQSDGPLCGLANNDIPTTSPGNPARYLLHWHCLLCMTKAMQTLARGLTLRVCVRHCSLGGSATVTAALCCLPKAVHQLSALVAQCLPLLVDSVLGPAP